MTMNNALQGVSVFLVGLMGVGKTTVGKHLAGRLGYGFCDTDAVIEGVAGCTIAEIFRQQGEPAFRELEHQVLRQLSPYTRLVVATGGGIILRSDNWGYLRDGLVVWLDLAPELIIQRLQADPQQVAQRPLLQSADPLSKLQELYTQRLPYYQQADLQISAQGTPPEVVDRLLLMLPTVLKCHRSPNGYELN